jgi:hypothetical protein
VSPNNPSNQHKSFDKTCSSRYVSVNQGKNVKGRAGFFGLPAIKNIDFIFSDLKTDVDLFVFSYRIGVVVLAGDQMRWLYIYSEPFAACSSKMYFFMGTLQSDENQGIGFRRQST